MRPDVELKFTPGGQTKSDEPKNPIGENRRLRLVFALRRFASAANIRNCSTSCEHAEVDVMDETELLNPS